MKQDIDQKTRRLFLIHQSSGQAAVEYILIVTIAVSLVIALKGAFKGANEFINNYLGTYTACLMEYGELPSLGVQNSDLNKHLSEGKQCEAQFKNFTLAEGRPPVGGSSAAGGRAGANGKNDKNAGNEKSSETDGGSSSSDKNSKDRGIGAGGGSGAGNTAGIGSARRGRNSADGARIGPSKTTLIDEEDAEGRAGTRTPGRQTRTIYRTRDRYRALTGELAEQIESQSKQTTKRTPTSRNIAKSEGQGLGPRIGLAKMPDQKVIVIEEEKSEGWSFGNFLKWVLIIGMIVALLVFFGGQIMNYSNSDS